MRPPHMSGHCRFPATKHPEDSHERCQRRGHGNTANPEKEFSPCPCRCHLGDEEFECGNCGVALREAPHWPNEDEPGEMVYVHVDENGNALGEECAHLRKTAVEPEPEDTAADDEPSLDIEDVLNSLEDESDEIVPAEDDEDDWSDLDEEDF